MILVGALGGSQALGTGENPAARQSAQTAANEAQTSLATDEEELSIELEQLPADIAALLSAAPPAVPPPPPAPAASGDIDLTFTPEDAGPELEVMFDEQSGVHLLPKALEAAGTADALVEFTLPSTPDSLQMVPQSQSSTPGAVNA